MRKKKLNGKLMHKFIIYTGRELNCTKQKFHFQKSMYKYETGMMRMKQLSKRNRCMDKSSFHVTGKVHLIAARVWSHRELSLLL